jgi:V/A-type H+-transporting ATPase subunit C
MKARIDAAREALGEQPEPHAIAVYFDRAYFAELRALADDIGNAFILDLVKHQIDTANMKIFLRSRKLGRELRAVRDEFLSGGNVDPLTYWSLYEEEGGNAVRALGHALSPQWDPILERFLADSDLGKLERDVVAYAYAKRNAARNVRIIMTGKFNGLSPQEIREKVRSIW